MATISASPGIVVGGRPESPLRTPTLPRRTAAQKSAARRVELVRPLVLLLVAAATAAAGFGAIRDAVESSATTSTIASGVESVAHPAWTVQPGDTLWAIASSARPQADPRATVLVLRDLNDLGPDRPLQPGQVILLPSP
jgi:LysM repeat protein